MLLQVILFRQFGLACVHLTPQESTVCVVDLGCKLVFAVVICFILFIELVMMWITVGYIKCSYSRSKVDTCYDNQIIIAAVVSFHSCHLSHNKI